MQNNNDRLVFLDWVRIIAFFLLILYHVGMYYVSWDWHVKSTAASSAIEPFMLMSSPWRLGLLFLVSGVASGVMLDKPGFVGQRTLRLLPPLLFGMFVIVPPQAYFEVVEKLGYAGGYAEFMGKYVAGYHGFCRKDDCLALPTWNHLWFVAYLLVYSWLLWALAQLRNARLSALFDRMVAGLQGWKLVLLPALVLAIWRIALFDIWPPKNNLTSDWYNHALYGSLFLFGAVLAKRRAFWDRVAVVRWLALALAVTCWGAVVTYFSWYSGDLMPAGELRLAMRLVYCLLAWCAMLAATGFARVHLHNDGPARQYLTEAVFPVYILHQTLIVSLAHWFKPAGLSPTAEGTVLVLMTLSLSFLGFELARRITILRPLFGLKWTASSATMAFPKTQNPRKPA